MEKRKKDDDLKLPASHQLQEIELSDLHHPMNHFGFVRFDDWYKKQLKANMQMEKAFKEGEDVEKLRLKQIADPFFKQGDKVEPVGRGQEDMVNILLTMNYLAGFTAVINEAMKDAEA